MRVHSFVLKDPNADLISKDFSIYITWKEPEDDGFVFRGYMWDIKGMRKVSDGFIAPDSVRFITTEDDNHHNHHDSPMITEYRGHFSPKTSLYHGNYRPFSEFAIKNQKIIFPTSQPPLPPMLLYKQDIFHEVERQHHGKKFSELNSLIAEKWKNLDEEERSSYENKYKESVAQYRAYWEEACKPANQFNAVPELQNSEIDHDRYLAHIFESAKYEYNGPGSGLGVHEHDYRENDLRKPKSSWDKALAFIQKKYRRFLQEYEDRVDILNSGGSNTGRRRSLYAYMIHWFSFKAEIVDRVEGKVSTISVSKLNSELNKRFQRVAHDKKFLTINILREKDFDPQTIREVLLLLPQPEVIFRSKFGYE